MNIGSLGVDYHYTGKNFIVIASIYEGIGPVSQRIKMEIISHGWNDLMLFVFYLIFIYTFLFHYNLWL